VRQTGPVFRHDLHAGLRRLGVSRGATLLVHGSMSALGWVCGGATEVVAALLDAVGPEGNIVVPAQTPDNRLPQRWTQYPQGTVPHEWWLTLQRGLPAFDPRLTPSVGMGAIAERVRTWPGAERSAHPQTSFAAIGPRARELMAGHELESQLGEASPLRKLAEDRHAHVLLLGVGFDKCTAFHLAEYRLPHVTMRDNYCVVAGPNGRRQWQRYRTVRLDDRDFARLGHDFEDGNPAVAAGHLGDAKTRRFPVGAAVDFALKWFMSKRQPVTP
jgi:aminoglycoside 3-N-acetyltransferase